MTPKQDRVSRVPESFMLGAAFVIVLVIALFSQRAGEAARIADGERKREQEVIRIDTRLLSTLKDAETGQRGFLLTGNERYLAPYNDALAAIPLLLGQLRSAVAYDSEQARRLQSLEPLVMQKLEELKQTVDLRRAGRDAEALAVVETDAGKSLMDEARGIGLAIEEIASRRRAESERVAERASGSLRRLSTGGSGLLAGLLVLATVTIFRGMSRRDRLFKDAQTGRSLLATTLSAIADGVIATGADGRITFINPVALKLTGWTEQEAVGTHISRVFVIINETTRNPVPNPLEKSLARGVIVGLANHTNLVSRSGHEIPIDDSAAPLKSEDGEIFGAVLVFRDITVRRAAEKRLRGANSELQQFVDAAAHDLRSPLNTIASMAQLLEAKAGPELGPSGREVVAFITGGLDRMRALLDDLLTFARSSHFDETAARPLGLDGPLRTALQNLRGEIDGTGAVVTSENLPVIAIHESHAILLFQNIIGNAIKYRGPDPPRIRVGAEWRETYWLIGISDNGMGIDSPYLEQIFSPFKRLHSDDDYPGSGIGLSTCRKIVNGYGGRIWAESKPGNGSTFYILLPEAAQASHEASA